MTDPAPSSANETVTDPSAGATRRVLDDLGKLSLRLSFGVMMLLHGIPKIKKFEGTAQFMDGMLGLPGNVNAALAIGAEVGCSILLIIGLATRLAAIPLAFTMGVAIFVAHAKDGWEKQEMAALYLAAYVAVFLLGPGRIALDHLIAGRKKPVA